MTIKKTPARHGGAIVKRRSSRLAFDAPSSSASVRAVTHVVHSAEAAATAKAARRPKTDREKVNELLAGLDWIAPPKARDLDLSEPGTVKIKPGRERKLTWQ